MWMQKSVKLLEQEESFKLRSPIRFLPPSNLTSQWERPAVEYMLFSFAHRPVPDFAGLLRYHFHSERHASVLRCT
jgi:hypothetical protein